MNPMQTENDQTQGVVLELDKAGRWREKPVRFKHYKGGEYELVCEAILESDRHVMMMVYRSSDGRVWTRPSDDFFALVEHNGKTVQRFQQIT